MKLKYVEKHKYSTIARYIIIMLLIMSGFSACSKKEEAVIAEPTILSIDGVIVEKEEIMIYVYQVVEEFQKIGGENVWEFEDFSGGKSAIEVAKEAVLQNIIRMKVINKKADELAIELTPEQKLEVKLKAGAFFDALDANYIETYNITLGMLEKVFIEFETSNEVIANVTSDFTPSEEKVMEKMNANDEYRRIVNTDASTLLTEIKALHILIDLRIKDTKDTYIELSEEEKALQLEIAEKVHNLANEGVPFENLINEYSDEELTNTINDINLGGPNAGDKKKGQYTFYRGLLPGTQFEALIELYKGDISPIIEDATGYHLFKILDVIEPTEIKIQSFNEKFKLFEDKLRLSIESDLIRNAFDQLYMKWKDLVPISLNKELWEQISLQI